jgi:hypothetical protein
MRCLAAFWLAMRLPSGDVGPGFSFDIREDPFWCEDRVRGVQKGALIFSKLLKKIEI